MTLRTQSPFASLLFPLVLWASAAWASGCVEVVSSGRDAAAEPDDDAAEDDGGSGDEDGGDGPDEPDAGSGGRDGGRDARAPRDATDDGSEMDATPEDAAEAGEDAAPDASPDAGNNCPQCPAGRCLADNTTCIECSAELPCADTALKCDVANHKCVACLPSADTCPQGQYCAANMTCVEGCKDGASCGSGRCDANRECVSCLDDNECGAGRACGTFECGGSCGGASDPACASGRDCCTGRCIDTKRDIAHCGGCGIACTATQFCGKSGCTDVAVSKLCDTTSITVVLSGATSDAAQSQLLASALGAKCPDVQIQSVTQDETALLNPMNGRPLAGGNNTLVTLGSAYSNRLSNYLETQGIAPVYMTALFDEQPHMFEFRLRRNGMVLLRGPVDGEIATKAHFLLQLVRDPASGSLVVSAYGYWAEGTVAARWFLAEQVLGSLSSFTDGWYLYQWDDVGAAGPDVGDTFTLISSGS